MMNTGIDKTGLFYSTLQANKERGIKKELDKDAFLQLMLTQMKYQDPTAPMDSKEMIQQVSQLSQTEQIMNMSKSFQNMVSSQLTLYRMQATGLVGKNAVVEDNKMALKDGVTQNVIFDVDKSSNIKIEIYNANEKLIYSDDLGVLPKGINTFSWNGRNANGVAMPDGTYEYKLYRMENGQKVEITGLDGGKVEAVQFEGEKFYVIVNGRKFPISAIKEIAGETKSDPDEPGDGDKPDDKDKTEEKDKV